MCHQVGIDSSDHKKWNFCAQPGRPILTAILKTIANINLHIIQETWNNVFECIAI